MNLRFTIPAIITVAMIFSCQPAKIALSDASLNEKEFKVSGRKGLFTKEKMSFGDYHTISVKRSWTKGTSARNGWHSYTSEPGVIDNVISTEYMKKKQTVRFRMADGMGNESEASCISNFNSKDLQIGNKPNSIVNIAAEIFFKTDAFQSNYYAEIYTNKNVKPWQLLIDNEAWQAQPKKYTGLVALDKDNYYTLVPVTRMQGKNGKSGSVLFGSVGFEILNKENKAVAAIGLFNKGVVYIADLPADEKFLLANICAAILMQEQLG